MKSLYASIPVILAMALAAPGVPAQTAAAAGDATAAAAPAEPEASGPVTSASDQSASASATADARKAAPDNLQARLEAAQRRLEAEQSRLEAAAREVAELSAESGQAVVRQYSFLSGPGRAIIGVQLENPSGGGGAQVRDVSPGGPAAEAGIRAGDVITAVNGTEIKGADAARQVAGIVRHLRPENRVRIEVSRNGKSREFTLTARRGPEFQFFGPGPGAVMIAPADPAAPAAPAAPLAPPAFPIGAAPLFLARGPLADMELATLTSRLGSYFGTDNGVLVVRAPADGALKLEDGDVILSIDGRVPTSGPHATRILSSYQPGEKIDIRIMRERKRMDIATTMPEGARRGGNQIYFRSGGFGAPNSPGRVFIMRGGEST